MALTLVSITGSFDPATRDKASMFRKVALACLGAGSGSATATAQAELLKAPDFIADFTTPDNGALNKLFALNGTLGKGVTFPANTMRTIKMICRSSNDTDTLFQEVDQDVWGNDGTTPKLGDARLVRAFKIASGTLSAMGRVHMRAASDGTEATDGMCSAGSSIAALTNGVAVLTYPASRAVRCVGVNFASDTYDATKGCVPHIAIFDADGTARIDLGSADDGLVDTTPATGTLDVAMELWPQAQIQLVMNSTTVEVHARTTISDVYTHKCQVFVGKLQDFSLGL